MTEELEVIDPQEHFQDFLKTEEYRQRIAQMALAGETSITVDFEDIVAFDPEVAEEIIRAPDEYLKPANNAAYAQLRIEDPEYAEELESITVRIAGLLHATKLRKLGSRHIGKLVMVQGIVVRATPVRPMVMRAVFRCKRCGETTPVDQKGPFLRAPFACSNPSCRRKGPFDFIQEESTFIDSQHLKVQERPEDLPPGQLPRSLDVRLVGSGIVDQARPGDHVSIVGVVRAVAPTRPRAGKNRTFNLHLDANSIEVLGKEAEVVLPSPEEEEKILELSKDPWIHRKIMNSVAPSIYGYDHVKEAIMYLLFGGVPKELPDIKIRGELNVLLIGDPGTAKCVQGSSLVILADGTITEIGNMVDSAMSQSENGIIDDGYYVKANRKLLSLNSKGEIKEGISPIFWKREAPRNLYEVSTKTGRTITVTPTHPFFTLNKQGFIAPLQAKDLKVHDFIATPRRLKVHGKPQKLSIKIRKGKTNAQHIRVPERTTPELCRIIGYLLGEGYCYVTTTYQIIFTNMTPELREDFSRCVEKVFGISPYAPPSHRGKDLWISSLEAGRFFEKLIPGIFLGAAKKEIPEMMTRCSDIEIANLLRAYFDSDATVNVKEREITLVSASEKLLRQVQFLLLRFGILSQLKQTPVKGKTYARLRISGEDIVLYGKNIGFLHPEKSQRLKSHLESQKKFNTNLNVVPSVSGLIKQIRRGLRLYQSECGVPQTTFKHYEHGHRNPSLNALERIYRSFKNRLMEVTKLKDKIKLINDWRQVRIVRRRLRISQQELASSMNVSQTLISQYELGKLDASENKLLRAAKVSLRRICGDIASNRLTKQLSRLKMLVESDIFWDQVSSIKQLTSKEKWVYDLQVNGIHNFVANGIFVHNSQLLQYVGRLAPRGLYTSGRGTTAAGLTAAVLREKQGGMTLEAGALVLADKGIACIDEMDKMRKEDRVAIHEAMEQHTVSVAKGGIVATLNARTAILAAANPSLGRYEPHRTVAENISLPVTILSRFDLIFVLRDKPNKDLDSKMSQHILQIHRKGLTPVEPPISTDLLRKYITYAKRIKPVLTQEALQRLKDFYMSMRSASETEGSPVAITARQLESLVRIAEGRARSALRKEISAEDAEAAIAIMKKSLQQVGIDVSSSKIDIDLIMTGKPKSLRDKLQTVLSTIMEMEKETGLVEKTALVNELETKYDITMGEADRLIGQLLREGTIYSPKEGYLKKT